MRSPLLLSAVLALGACGDEGSSPPPIDGSSAPTGRIIDAGSTMPRDARVIDAARDAARDAAWVQDATLARDAALVDAGPAPCNPSLPPAAAGLALQAIVSGQGLDALVDARQPPDSNDWYLVQQDGLIRVLQGGMLRPREFLDLRAEITLLNEFVYEDRGLVSLEFAPDYASSGRFYVALTPNLGAERNLDQIRSYTRSLLDPYVADPSTRKDVLSLAGSHVDGPNDYTTNIHNGGRLSFGPDGMLYFSMGDGGGVRCGDSEPNAPQDVGKLFGKLLRLDLSQPPPYGALDNPFVENGDPRVLHYGLRNVRRYSFDRLTGDLYLGDVGQDTFEELDFAPAGSKGLNFGWSHYEGSSDATCGLLRPLRAGSAYTPPIVSINRGAGSSGPFSDYDGIVGGVVYRGAALPQLQGSYLFGDVRGANLGALRVCGGKASPLTPIAKTCDASAPAGACLTSLEGSPALESLRAIVEDRAGELYFVANRNTLFKLVALPVITN